MTSTWVFTDQGWVEIDTTIGPTPTPIQTTPTTLTPTGPMPTPTTPAQTSPRLGERALCALCGLDIELIDEIKNLWHDRGGNKSCSTGALHTDKAFPAPTLWARSAGKSSTGKNDPPTHPDSDNLPVAVGQVRRFKGIAKFGVRKGRPYATHTVVAIAPSVSLTSMVTVKYNSGKTFDSDLDAYTVKSELIHPA